MPALNPRLVKEADALTDTGYLVTVLFTYWNDWGANLNNQLLGEKKWTAIQVGGDPVKRRAVYFLSRLIHKTARLVLQKTGRYHGIAEFAIARGSHFLVKEAKKHKADLYIAHNLGALPAAAKAATFYGKPYGFDAEDFHRQEVDDNTNTYHYKLVTYLEDKYLPAARYLTGGSPLIAGEYARLYKRPVTGILNVFPKVPLRETGQNEDQPLKLFWFSQNLGPKRGLETIIEALGKTQTAVELHLLGKHTAEYKQQLLQIAKNNGINADTLFFYPPVKADEIFAMAAGFDIGIASETGFCLNNNIALSNKIFTYIQSGLAVAVSNTPAQSGLLDQYPQIGKIYNNANELAAIITAYGQNRDLLRNTKKTAFTIGQTTLNWETESRRFLTIIKNALAAPFEK